MRVVRLTDRVGTGRPRWPPPRDIITQARMPCRPTQAPTAQQIVIPALVTTATILGDDRRVSVQEVAPR